MLTQEIVFRLITVSKQDWKWRKQVDRLLRGIDLPTEVIDELASKIKEAEPVKSVNMSVAGKIFGIEGFEDEILFTFALYWRMLDESDLVHKFLISDTFRKFQYIDGHIRYESDFIFEAPDWVTFSKTYFPTIIRAYRWAWKVQDRLFDLLQQIERRLK